MTAKPERLAAAGGRLMAPITIKTPSNLLHGLLSAADQSEIPARKIRAELKRRLDLAIREDCKALDPHKVASEMLGARQAKLSKIINPTTIATAKLEEERA